MIISWWLISIVLFIVVIMITIIILLSRTIIINKKEYDNAHVTINQYHEDLLFLQTLLTNYCNHYESFYIQSSKSSFANITAEEFFDILNKLNDDLNAIFIAINLFSSGENSINKTNKQNPESVVNNAGGGSGENIEVQK